MGSYADWNVLTVWTLGWGADRAASDSALSVVPSPDALWGAAVAVWAVVATASARGAAARAGGGDEAAAERAIMPTYFPLLAATGVGGAVLAAGAVAVTLLEYYPFRATLPVLAAVNVVRCGAMEVLTHGVTALLLQAVVSHGALRRAAAVAAAWAVAVAAASSALLAAYWGAMNASAGDGGALAAATAVPRYTAAAINAAIVAAYAGGILFANYGRPALRPYAWFVVLWRGLTAAGLLLSAHAAVVPTGLARVFDCVFLVLVVVGYPTTLYAALVADTAYWRGMCRGTPGAVFSWRTALLSGLCGCGDMGVGLGLRGWGDTQRAAVRHSARTGALGLVAAPLETGAAAAVPPARRGPACCHAALRAVVSCCQGRARARRWSFATGLDVVLAAELPPPRDPAVRLLAPADRAPSWSVVHRWSARADVLPDTPLSGLMALLDAHHDHLLDFVRLRLTHVLTESATAVVFQGFYHRTPIAAKVLRATPTDASAVFAAARHEMAVARALQHPAIVSCLGLCCCPPDVAVVFELCSGGTLRAALSAAVAADIPLLAAALAANGALPRPAAAALYTRGYVYIPVRYVRASLLRNAAAAAGAELAAVFAAASRGWLRLVAVDDAVVDTLPEDVLQEDAAAAALAAGDDDAATYGPTIGALFDSVRRVAAAAMAADAPAVAVGGGGAPSPRKPVTSMMRRSALHARLASQDSLGRIAVALASGAAPPVVAAPVVPPAPLTSLPTASPAAADPTVATASGASRDGTAMHTRITSSAVSGVGGAAALAHQRQLMADMAVLGGLAVDVLDFPYSDPDVWPVDDVEEFAYCWQFDPGAGTAMAPEAAVAAAADALEPPPSPAATAAAASLTAAGQRHRVVGTVAVLQPLMSPAAWAAAMSAAAGDAPPVPGEASTREAAGGPPVLSWLQRLRVAARVADAVAYMHSRAPPAAHTDLTSANVLLTADGTAKVADFGSVHAGGAARGHSLEDDVYALCTILWELLTGGLPFDVLQPGAAAAVTECGARLPIPARCPRAFAHLLRCGWHGEPAMRPPAALVAAVLRRLADVATLVTQLADIDLGGGGEGVRLSGAAGAGVLEAIRHASARRSESASGSLLTDATSLAIPVYKRDLPSLPSRVGGVAGAAAGAFHAAPAARGSGCGGGGGGGGGSLRLSRGVSAARSGTNMYLPVADSPGPFSIAAWGATTRPGEVEMSRAPVTSLRDVELE